MAPTPSDRDREKQLEMARLLQAEFARGDPTDRSGKANRNNKAKAPSRVSPTSYVTPNPSRQRASPPPPRRSARIAAQSPPRARTRQPGTYNTSAAWGMQEHRDHDMMRWLSVPTTAVPTREGPALNEQQNNDNDAPPQSKEDPEIATTTQELPVPTPAQPLPGRAAAATPKTATTGKSQTHQPLIDLAEPHTEAHTSKTAVSNLTLLEGLEDSDSDIRSLARGISELSIARESVAKGSQSSDLKPLGDLLSRISGRIGSGAAFRADWENTAFLDNLDLKEESQHSHSSSGLSEITNQLSNAKPLRRYDSILEIVLDALPQKERMTLTKEGQKAQCGCENVEHRPIMGLKNSKHNDNRDYEANSTLTEKLLSEANESNIPGVPVEARRRVKELAVVLLIQTHRDTCVVRQLVASYYFPMNLGTRDRVTKPSVAQEVPRKLALAPAPGAKKPALGLTASKWA